MNKKIRGITETGICVALAVILDITFKAINLFPMPNGGRISLAMLPVLIIGFRNGLKYGLIGGLSYAIINFMLDGFFWHWGSIFFDYLFPFTALGLTGLFYKKSSKFGYFLLGMLIPILIRWVFHGLSGVIFFGEYAADYFGTSELTKASVWLYSFIIYNAPYCLGSGALCMIVGSGLYKFIIPNHISKVEKT